MTTHDGPADTRAMGIVHHALKRDLLRARQVLAAAPAPQGRQRVALGEHVLWMLDFLHDHHTGEDAHLWPVVREHNPDATELLDSMEADHARIAPEADAVGAAAREYTATTSDPPRAALVETLDSLVEVLVPHLDREVAEAMPVVESSITNREWEAYLQNYNVKPKTARQLVELAMQLHWVLEGIDSEGYDVAVGVLPTPIRFILIRGFGWAYRRRADARWTPAASAVSATS